MSSPDPDPQRHTNVFRFRTMGTNALRGTGFWRDDATVSKTFSLGERLETEFRAEVYNLANTVRWNDPNAASACMQLNPDGTLRNANKLMSVTSAESNYERQFRFDPRLSF